MALDGILLHKIVPGIQEVLPARIQKIYQISSSEVLFVLHGRSGKKQLLVSCHSQYNRMLLTDRSYPTPNEPSNFVMLLRKHLEGSTIFDMQQAGLDRWVDFTIRRTNNLGDGELIHMYVELMGKYANLILVNTEGRIIDAMKRIPPFTNINRIIQPGAMFTPMESQNKRDPFKEPYIEEGKTLVQQFSGFSPFLAKECEHRLANGQSFESIMKEIEASNELFICAEDDKAFHCIECTHVGVCHSYPLFEGFDILYYHKEEHQRIQEISGDIFKVVKRELKHQTQKLPRLLQSYDEALDCDKWNKYGELLYVYQVKDTQGKTEITLKDYETDQDITIPLDPKLDGNRNAQKCYTKYGKLKKGQVYIQEQIDLTKQEITYFEGLMEQLEYADFETATEIKQELIKGGYIKEKVNPKKRRKKKKEEAIRFKTITLENGVSISFGKNNLQNDTLTFHHARKNEIWLHAKDYHGSHVVIHESNPDEETLRLASNIAAYFSGGRNSSSVPVNYCPLKEIKKIPGAKPGMVRIGKYRTIYIDPDPKLLESYGVPLF